MASAEFEVEDYLTEARTRSLRRELDRRIAAGDRNALVSVDNEEPWCPFGLASDIRGAFYARDAPRLEYLLMVLERKEGP